MQHSTSRSQSRGLVTMVTDLSVGEDAALGQPEPEPRVGVVHLDGLGETVEGLLGPAGVQEGDARVVDQLVVPRAADRVDRHTAVPVTCWGPMQGRIRSERVRQGWAGRNRAGQEG